MHSNYIIASINTNADLIIGFGVSRKITFIVMLLMLCVNLRSQDLERDSLFSLTTAVNYNSQVYSDYEESNIIEEYESVSQNIFDRESIGGDLWGFRNTLSESGLDFEFVYKGEFFSTLSGGFERGTTSLDNIDLVFSADLEKSLGIGSTQLTLQFLGNSGGVPNDYAGTSQGISNIETIATWKIYQLLVEKKFLDDQFSILAGLYDLNSEFDTRESSGIFINPSHGIGPDFAQSGYNGPSIFPTTSLALRLKYESENENYIQAAVFDGIPGDPEDPFGTQVDFNKNDGFLLTAEAGLVNSVDEQFESKLAIGVWTYTSDFEKYTFADNGSSAISHGKNYGIYLTGEKLLYSDSEITGRTLYGFIRLGYANTNINPVDKYIGAGLKFAGLFSGREEDEFGIAVAYAHNSPVFRETAAMLDDEMIRIYELNFETTYTFSVTPWLMIQPDFQYIINPSCCPDNESVFVVGSRMQLTF